MLLLAECSVDAGSVGLGAADPAQADSTSSEWPYFPPWATSDYDARLLELGDIQNQAVSECLAARGIDFDGYSRFDVPIRFRVGSMTPEKAERFGYGATFSLLSSSATRRVDLGTRQLIAERLAGTDEQPGCFEAGSDARLAAAGDFLDIFGEEKLDQINRLNRDFRDSDEYETWASAWYECMLTSDVEPRQQDPLSHEAAVRAVLAGALAGADIESFSVPLDRTFDLVWFDEMVARFPDAQATFDEERAIARVDAACTQETSAEFAAALAVIGY